MQAPEPAAARGDGAEGESRELQHALLENTTSGILIARERRIVLANTTMASMLGRTPHELAGHSTRVLYIDDAEFDRVGLAYAPLGERGTAVARGIRLRRADGGLLVCDLHGRLLADRVTSVWTYADVTAREAQESNLRRAQRVYRALVAGAESLLESVSEQALIDRLCQSLLVGTEFVAVRLLLPDAPGAPGAWRVAAQQPSGGRDTGAAVAQAWQNRATCAQPAQRTSPASLATPVRRAEHQWGVLEFVAEHDTVFDEATRTACEQVAALLGHGLDEFDRKAALQQLQDAQGRLARTDALTGLANRLALEEYLPGALARAQRRGRALAVGMIDLDDFKPVNDRFGHAAGDILLQGLARALRERMRDTDLLARLGGDEFVVVLEDVDATQPQAELERVLQRLHRAVEQPFELGEGRRAVVGMTAGVALFPLDAEQPSTLLRLADAAMYACKARKIDRPLWWLLHGADHGDPAQTEVALDAFDERAASMLRALDAGSLNQVAETFAAAFYRELERDERDAALLHALTPQEYAALVQAQRQHLTLLLDPASGQALIRQRARHVGRVHALVGLAGASVERTSARYEALLREQLEHTPLSARQRYLILRVATARLRLDVQTQLEAIEQTIEAYTQVLRRPLTQHARWADELDELLRLLAGLPGVRQAIVLRPDEHGVLGIESGAGVGFDALCEAIDGHGLHPSLNPAPGTPRGPLSLAWFDRQVQVVDVYQRDPRLTRWGELARRFDWKSAAVVPICHGDATDSVLMLFGAHVHQFGSSWARSWLDLLRARVDAVFAATSGGPRPIDPARARELRQLLYSGHGLQMVVQPVVELAGGQVHKLEALARLRTPQGELLTPAAFLTAFSPQELHALFRQGLGQALGLLRQWRADGLDLEVSVNLPPVTLAHPDCAAWIRNALQAAHIEPRRLRLEVLETEQIDARLGDAALHAISELGVHLALDDLGSGYSNLARLASLPIDSVKIDQSLMRELPRQPIKTMRLLATLVSIGHEFARHTVLEGLEDDGCIEVATLLGVQLGQGYGLARPMPAEEFPQWLRAWQARAPRLAGLHTWMGAFAYHWRSTRDLSRAPAEQAYELCPLREFLRRREVDDAQVLGWHRESHLAADAATRTAAAEALLAWLAERVGQCTT